MGTKHTAGPWQWDATGYVLRPVNQTGRYSQICELETRGRVTRCETMGEVAAMEAEGDANRRLIAAAPELLAALQAYQQAYPAFRAKPVGAPNSEARTEQESLIRLEDDARAVIAKATQS